MGKEVGVLKDNAHPALIRGKVEPLFTVKKRPAVKNNFTPIWLHQAREQVHECGLTTAGGAEDAGSAMIYGKVHPAAETSKFLFNTDFK